MSTNRIFILFLLLTIAIGIVAFVRIYLKQRRISAAIIKEEILKIPRFRTGLLLAALAFVVIFSVFYFRYASLRANVIITLNYSEAYKGQNANGTRYNMNEIICTDVLERALEKGAIDDISVTDLQKCLTVEPTVEGNAETEDTYHISTEFRVSYKGNKILDTDAETLVGLIGFAYKEYYIDHYADNFEPLDIEIQPEKEFADLDYLDIVQYLSNQVSVIQNYMYGMADKNAGFIASNGETFYSLATKCENIGTVQIQNNLQAYILDHGISKDTQEYIDRLSYDNTRMDYDRQKAVAGFNVRRDAINLYAEEMTRIVLVPTWDVEGEYYMGRTKVGIDQLSIEAEEYSKTAADYSKETETNQTVINAYSNAGGSGDNAYVDQLIQTISNEIMEVADRAEKVGQEYSETRMNSCVSVAVNGDSFIKYAVFLLVLFLMFYLMADFLIRQSEEIRKDR